MPGFFTPAARRCFLVAVIVFCLPAPGLVAGPFALRTAPGRVDFVEQKRRLVLLPLLNMTGDPKLDYLREGVNRILADRFKNAGFLWAERPETLLSVTPLPDAASRAEAPPTRLALAVEAATLDQRVGEILALGSPHRRAELMEADYLLDGGILSIDEFAKLKEKNKKCEDCVLREISAGAADLVLEINLFDVRPARSTRRFYRLDRRTVYDGLNAVAEDLFSAFLGRPLVKFRVDTPAPGAMVLIGDLYLGRTPLEYRLIPGTYTLQIRQPGFVDEARRIELSPGGATNFTFANRPAERRAGLRVITEPVGARVFLDHEFLGTTPLDRGDLPGGAHRVRVSRGGYVDRFVGVELRPGEREEFSFTLEKGNTAAVYRDPNYRVLDWDDHDLSFYSALNALGFYLGYIHFSVRAERTLDSVVALVPSLSLLRVNELGLYHYQIIQRKSNEAAVYRSYARASGGAGGFSLLASIFFLWRGIAVDQREVGEISFHISERVIAPMSAPVAPAETAPGGGAYARREPGASGPEAVYQIGLDFFF